MRPDDGSGVDELLRWRESSLDPSALPARAADLVDAARDAPALSPATLMRMYAEVADGRVRRRSRWRGVPVSLRLATLTALILVSVATAKGAMLLWQRYGGAPAPTGGPAAVESRPRRAVALRAPKVAATAAPSGESEASGATERLDRAVVPPPDESPAPAVAERAAAPPSSSGPRREPLRTGASPSARARLGAAGERRAASGTNAEPALAEPSSLGTAGDSGGSVGPINEAQLLADALARLRQHYDPRGALTLLDQYARSFPRGVLAPEARSARIEALLKLDDRVGALDLLDERAFFTGRFGAEQLLTRAELRASVGRHAEALSDFDHLLAPSAGLPAPALAALERALYGRAVTLGHLGRDQRARAELEVYLRRFPDGKHARDVKRLLEGRRPL